MVAQSPWQELARFEDRQLATAVATTIAAMEFDVRLRTCDVFVVEVDGHDLSELADVLDEIIDEQLEFDRAIAHRAAERGDFTVTLAITLTGAADLLALLGLLEL